MFLIGFSEASDHLSIHPSVYQQIERGHTSRKLSFGHFKNGFRAMSSSLLSGRLDKVHEGREYWIFFVPFFQILFRFYISFYA